MTRTQLLNHINQEQIYSVRNVRKYAHREVQLCKIEDGIILRDFERIYCYYNELIETLVQFSSVDEQITLIKDDFVRKILSSTHEISLQLYLYEFRYPLRDNANHVWINYNESQWNEIILSDFAPMLYDFDYIGTTMYC